MNYGDAYDEPIDPPRWLRLGILAACVGVLVAVWIVG